MVGGACFPDRHLGACSTAGGATDRARDGGMPGAFMGSHSVLVPGALSWLKPGSESHTISDVTLTFSPSAAPDREYQDLQQADGRLCSSSAYQPAGGSRREAAGCRASAGAPAPAGAHHLSPQGAHQTPCATTETLQPRQSQGQRLLPL